MKVWTLTQQQWPSFYYSRHIESYIGTCWKLQAGANVNILAGSCLYQDISKINKLKEVRDTEEKFVGEQQEFLAAVGHDQKQL